MCYTVSFYWEIKIINAQCWYILIIAQELYNTKVVKICKIISEYVWKMLTLNMWNNYSKICIVSLKRSQWFQCIKKTSIHLQDFELHCFFWSFLPELIFFLLIILSPQRHFYPETSYVCNWCANHTNCHSNLMSKLWLLVTHLPNHQTSPYHWKVLITHVEAFDHWPA